VVVLSDEKLRRIIQAAEDIQRKKEQVLARMARGESLPAMLELRGALRQSSSRPGFGTALHHRIALSEL
jgi:hypothetical protein